jgi:Outer membrane protein beta-barrel domain
MKKLLVLCLFVISAVIVNGQDSTKIKDTIKPGKPAKKDWSKVTMARSGDHFLMQLGIDNWANSPDSIDPKSLSRSFGIYLMMDFPFKTNPHFSIALGLGVSSSNMYFEDTYIDISGKNNNNTTLKFQDVKDTSHFKKFKLQTAFAEIPLEFRYNSNPENLGKSFKFAVGAKIGTMLSAGTKGKNLLSSSGSTVNSFTQKEKSKRYFNKTRLAVTGRIGYGSFSLFTAYQVNAYIKEGSGPDVRPYTIGLTISGL